MKHFSYFPSVEYGDVVLTNILLRAKIRDVVLDKAAVFYEYTVRDGERPDEISSRYYGNSDYTWAILYANEIYDPIHEWVKNGEQFYAYVKQKYGSVEKAASQLEEPHHYLLDEEYVIDKTTFLDNSIEASRKRAVSNYEYEFEKNEARRNIKIIDVVYLRQIVNEMKNIFK